MALGQFADAGCCQDSHLALPSWCSVLSTLYFASCSGLLCQQGKSEIAHNLLSLDVETHIVLDMLGKRKRKPHGTRQASPQASGSHSSAPEGVREAFRRHFEAQFKPLENVKLKAAEVSTPTQHTDSDSEWDGFSEPEGRIHLRCFYVILLI